MSKNDSENDKRYTETIEYSNGEETCQIHIVNGEAHVHKRIDEFKNGEISWDATGHHELDETDKKVIELVKAQKDEGQK